MLEHVVGWSSHNFDSVSDDNHSLYGQQHEVQLFRSVELESYQIHAFAFSANAIPSDRVGNQKPLRLVRLRIRVIALNGIELEGLVQKSQGLDVGSIFKCGRLNEVQAKSGVEILARRTFTVEGAVIYLVTLQILMGLVDCSAIIIA